MIKEPKGKYPSELNTKSIACRIPVVDYVEIVNECVEKGININDWLLTKVYSKKTIGNYDYSDNEELQELRDKVKYFNSLWDNDKVMTFPAIFGHNLKFDHAQDFLNWLFDYINSNNENYEKAKIPSLIDAKIQISEIAKSKFSNSDFRNFMSELKELLRELE